MEFSLGGRKPIKQPKEKKDECEIITEKTAKGIRRRISGSCTPAQLKALAGGSDLESDNDFPS